MCSCGHPVSEHVKVHVGDACIEFTCRSEKGGERDCHKQQHKACADDPMTGTKGTCNYYG
jgi:hypothetical protein